MEAGVEVMGLGMGNGCKEEGGERKREWASWAEQEGEWRGKDGGWEEHKQGSTEPG